MLKRLIGEDVSLVVSIDPLTPAVKMDRGQFNQVLMNLAVNARDAMPNGGTLTIHTSLMVVDEASPAKPGVAPGEYAILTVGDTGTGIPPEVRAHLFEPFFTTKEKGKGTGLGLATVYGIVEQSGGHVWCASQVGEGTTFSIYLPRARDAGMKTESKSESACGYRGSERVLLVEDEGAVRAILRTVLEENGYSVLACGNSADVARICEDHPGRIDLLIADMVLPGTSGLKIAETMSRRWPGMGVILMSGYADWNECLHMGAGLHCLHLQKPFQAETLLRNMRTMMEKGGAAGGP
jgi:CheY-like chemotaxis protein